MQQGAVERTIVDAMPSLGEELRCNALGLPQGLDPMSMVRHGCQGGLMSKCVHTDLGLCAHRVCMYSGVPMHPYANVMRTYSIVHGV